MGRLRTRSGMAGETDRKLGWLRDAAGDRYRDLELNMVAFAVGVTEDRAATMARVAHRFGIDPAEFDHFAPALFGTETQICEQLQSARERWDIAYWIFHAPEVDPIAPIVAALAVT